MAERTPTTAPVPPPRGFYPGRVDDKGRLKLPVKFQEYLNSLDDKTFFVTTMGRGIARIYPNTVWQSNENLFDEFTADPKAAQRIAFFANALGADAEMDSQGRILLPPELRRKLDIENQPVQLLAYRGRIDVYKQSLYEEELRKSEESLSSDLDVLERNGLR